MALGRRWRVDLNRGQRHNERASALGEVMDPIVVLLVVLIVLALIGSVAVSPLLLALVAVLVLFAVLGRGRYYARRG